MMGMKELLFGTAGIPLSTPSGGTINGILQVYNLGLAAMELEFVRNVNINKTVAPEVKKVAKKNRIVLTCHGQYYINLNSPEKTKTKASSQRIINAARIAWGCGAWSLCFHAAYYMKQLPESVYRIVKKEIETIVKTLRQENNNIWIRPELTGKPTQFGTLDELLSLSEDLEQVMPCIDFSHYHARTGKYNSYEEFSEILSRIEKHLGKQGLTNMHIHVSGIEYGSRGEKNHLNLKDSDFNYKELMKALKDFGVKGVLISESPNIEGDAILMRNIFRRL